MHTANSSASSVPKWDEGGVPPGKRAPGAEQVCSSLRLFLGHSEAMRTVLDQATRLSTSNADLLICGEPGTQKELIARSIHNAGTYAHSPFLSIDCRTATVPKVSDDFFSIACGGFSLSGQTAEPNYGTLFLNHVEGLPEVAQDSLVEALTQRTKPPDGATAGTGRYVRLMLAMNGDVSHIVSMGLCSRPLFEAMSEHTISVPPLRHRPEDILAVADNFRDQANVELRKSVRHFCPETKQVLLEHSWPGNYPELWNAVYRATLAADTAINPEELRELLREKTTAGAHSSETLLHQIIRAQIHSFELNSHVHRTTRKQKKPSLASRLLGLARRKRHNSGQAREKNQT